MSLRNQRKNAKAIRAILEARFPACFAGRNQPKRPLKCGIGKDIAICLPELGRIPLGDALADYTGGPTYLSNVIEGAERVDLDGVARGVVSREEAAFAAVRLARFRAWADANAQQATEAEAA